MIVALLLLSSKRQATSYARLSRLLVVPLAVVIIGLVTSATHLGNPANALYVFRGVGRSPLSTEVFFAVVFLLLGGIFWLQTFSLRPKPLLQRVWLAVIILVAVVFLTSMALAYQVPTILSWHTVFVPLGLLANAVAGGAILALLTLHLAGHTRLALPNGNGSGNGKGKTSGSGNDKSKSKNKNKSIIRIDIILLALMIAATLLSLLFGLLQALNLMRLQSAFLQGSDLAVWLYIALVLFAVCAGISCTLIFTTLTTRNADQKSLQDTLKGTVLLRIAASCILMLVGIFALRLAFYAIHMTVGL